MKGINGTMISRVSKSSSITVLVMLLSLLIAYSMDLAKMALRDYASSSFHILPYFIFRFTLPFVMVLMFLALMGFLLRSSPNPNIKAFLYLAFGLLGIISFGSQFAPFPSILRSTFIGQFWSMLGKFGFDSIFFWISSYILVLGIIGVVFRKKVIAIPPRI
jgi:hypothetical protein